jgi:cell division protein FtsQ
MKYCFKTKLETRKYRFKRHGKNILREISKAVLLVLVIFTVAAAMIHGYQYVISSTYFQIKETIVRGCKELTEKDVLSLVAIKPSQNLLCINLDAVSKRISSNPWIKDAYVGRELPNRLVIEIRERTAVALVKQESGFYLLDPEGIPFKRLQSGDETDLPVLSGCYTEEKAHTQLLTKSLELLRFLSNLKDSPTLSRVSEIHGHEVFGLSLFTDSGLCLQLGFDHYENKLKRLVPVMADLDRKNLKPGFLLIDLSDPTKITVQRRNVLGPTTPAGLKKGLRT